MKIGISDDMIDGTIYEITEEELDSTDKYEVA